MRAAPAWVATGKSAGGAAAAPGAWAGRAAARVYVVHHVRFLPGDVQDVRLLGVYSSRTSALEAVDRARAEPEFQESPRLLNDEDAGYDGFHIHEIAR
jgi:hypothetical protein